MDVPRQAGRPISVAVVSLVMVLSLCISDVGGGLEVGEKAPLFTLLDTEDGPQNLTDYRGRVLVLEFFTTWCTYCSEQLGELKDLDGRVDPSRVAFLMVDADDQESRPKVADYRSSKNIKWPVCPKGGKVASDYGVDAYPTTLVVDQEGVVRAYEVGVVSTGSLKDVIDGLL